MSQPVSTIRNLGPASDTAFARAGIHTAEDLRDLGPDEAYRRLLQSGGSAHFVGYYAMVMGLQGRPWNDCKGKEKDELRARFDAIKASVSSTSLTAIEAVLNEIGVVARPSSDGS